ncbi:MAG TPA: hypothetical protein VG147_04720 [Solirubrobacteraceae bacterium]|jgi:hypothetical protein|nr:hypothetical protein [Solirubrobacteraceae bacterium]
MAAENGSNAGSTEPPSAAELTRGGAGLLRRLLVPKGLAWLIGGGVGSGGLLLAIPPRGVYYLTAAGGVTYAARYGVHLRIGYAKVSDQLARLMRTDLVVVIAFNFLGFASIGWKPSSGAMAGSVLVLFMVVLLVSGATLVAAEGKVPRGSEWLRARNPLKWVESSLGPHADLFGKPFLWVIRLATPVRKASCYIVCLLAMLVVVGAAAGRASLPAIEKSLHLDQGAHTSSTPTSTTPDPETSTTTTATTPATGSSTIVKEAPPPTYEALCHDHVKPGYPAPEPQAGGLRGLFAETGAIVAGCAQPAAEVSAGSGVWWTLGRCDGEVRSLAVAGAETPAVLMLQQVARFAQGKAERGELMGGSPRISAAHGDYQVIETATADFVMAREDSSLGGNTTTKPPRSCGELSDRDSPYTLVPPGLVELWLQLARRAWVWPVASGETTAHTKQFIFRSVGRAPAEVATAECSSEDACTMRTAGGTSTSADSYGKAANELERYAPQRIG